jgi:hypothetical protein
MASGEGCDDEHVALEDRVADEPFVAARDVVAIVAATAQR